MPVILVKKVRLNKDEIMLYRKVRPKRFLKLISVWVPWKLMNNDVYKLEWEVVKRLDEIDEYLNKIRKLEAVFKKEHEEINDAVRCRYGESKPFRMKAKWDEYKKRKVPDLDRPSPDWKKKLSENFLKATHEGKLVTERIRDRNRKKAGRSAYTIDDITKHNLDLSKEELDLDDVTKFDPNRGKSGNQNKGKKKSNRSKRESESPQEHKERLARIDSGEASPEDLEVTD